MQWHEEKITEFKEYLVALGYSKGSVYTLPGCVKEFLSRHGSMELPDLTSQHIENFYEYLQQRPHKRRAGGLSSMRIHHFIYSIRLFFSWLQQTGEMETNPISGMIFPSPETSPREILTQEEIREVYNCCQTLRDRAILSVIYGCGLRRAEAELLNISDIHFREQLLYVREGKGKKRRVIPMTEKITEDLKNYYFHERSSYIKTTTKDNQQAFILNKKGERMKGERYYVRVKELIRLTNDTKLKAKSIGLHSLRHSIATHLLENGLPVEYVRDFLGHEFLETTKIYTRVSKKQLTDEF